MIVTPQTERVRTLDQVRAFVQGSEAVDPHFHRGGLSRGPTGSRSTSSCAGRWCGWTTGLGRLDKGLVKRYLAKVTGLSWAQLTRLIGMNR